MGFAVKGAGGENESARSGLLVSRSSMREIDSVLNQAGGRMFARRCCFRRRASHNGSKPRRGGARGWVGPWPSAVSHVGIWRIVGSRHLNNKVGFGYLHTSL